STPAAMPPRTCATRNAAPTSLKRNSTSKSISADPNLPDLGPNPRNAILLNGALGLVFVGVEHCSTPSRQDVSKTVIPNGVCGVRNLSFLSSALAMKLTVEL